MSTASLTCNCNPVKEAPYKICGNGANAGEGYWACVQRKEQGGCGFFKWANAALNNKRPRMTGYAPIPPPVTYTPPSSDSNEMTLLLVKDLIEKSNRQNNEIVLLVQGLIETVNKLAANNKLL